MCKTDVFDFVKTMTIKNCGEGSDLFQSLIANSDKQVFKNLMYV